MLPEALGLLDARAALVAGVDDYLLRLNRGVPEELGLMNRLGFGCPPEHVISITTRKGWAKFAEPHHREVLRTAGPIEFFAGTSRLLRGTLDQLGVSYCQPSLKSCRTANSKIDFQRLGECYAINGDGRYHTVGKNLHAALIPRGGFGTPTQIQGLLRHLFDLSVFEVRLKPDASGSCIGHRNLTTPHGVNGYLLPDCRHVVQELVRCNIEFSIPFEIDVKGNFKLYDVCRQLIECHDGHDDFVGNASIPNGRAGLPTKMRRLAREAAEVIIWQTWKQHRYFGWGSIDFVGNTTTGTVKAIERNARITATYYPIMASLRRFGKVLPFHNRSRLLPPGMSIHELEVCFAGLLFGQPGTNTGLVPYAFIPQLPGENVGFFYGVVYAPTHQLLDGLVTRINERHQSLFN
ncbi:hypothetical protein KJ910_02350 [Patescibacteria group bacterium]|nr:hypothetical protein [Patescibacteria group bacterium]MBU1906858.1 hypothetical protein [Patescibacteria group bacterium]